LKNPDTGNLKFKFEILQGGEISRTNQITIIRARSEDWRFYFYSRHWLVYATGTVVLQVQYAPSLHLFSISDLFWLRIILNLHLIQVKHGKILFLIQYPDVFPRQSGKRNHFCYFISIYAKLLFCFSLYRKLLIELPGPLITQTVWAKPAHSNQPVPTDSQPAQ